MTATAHMLGFHLEKKLLHWRKRISFIFIIYRLGFGTSSHLYKKSAQTAIPTNKLYKLQLVQVDFTGCNMYKFLTCTSCNLYKSHILLAKEFILMEFIL